MNFFRNLLASSLLLTFIPVEAQRLEQNLNTNWDFRFSHQVHKGSGQRVDLPHTWNQADALSGKADYKRGVGNYEKKLTIPATWQGKRIFLKFEGAGQIANVFVNRQHIMEHRGGYGAFTCEITDRVDYGTDNSLLVRVNNGEQLDLMPLVGDFNFYGGIYRDVTLIVTDEVCISPLNYGSQGVFLRQDSVSREFARMNAGVQLSNGSRSSKMLEVDIAIYEGSKEIARELRSLTLAGASDSLITVPLSFEKPHLWNGRKDPFLYRAEVSVIENGKTLDRQETGIGLRYYRTDPVEGFFLNGEKLRLQGVCRHQDRAAVGNALLPAHHEEDMDLMLEMGVNAIRLAHYPQASYIYDLADKHGMIVWAEIPFVGPGGYDDKGFVDQSSFRANGREQLIEMIRQHGNHPSICFWGIFNELKEEGDNPVEYVRELNALAKEEDPSRPTTSASNQGGALNFITDLIAWNRYDGWYGGMPKDLGAWLDQTHLDHPELKIGISEYGAGGSILHQQDTLMKSIPNSWWHPENWQTDYHIENWKVIAQRPYVWGSFVWNMFDFGAAHRTEGDRPGINDKGLVTFDRKDKKDAFYFYKANWNKEVPTLHLAGKRNIRRIRATQSFMAFTNAPGAELFVNGRSVGKAAADSFGTVKWNGIQLQKGKNEVKVISIGKGKQITDQCVVDLE